MKMESLPVELVYKIQSYIYRPDWRTCKKKEAEIISDYKSSTDECIDTFCIFDFVVHEDWTLYGKQWLLHADVDQFIARRRPLFYPPPMENYNQWYLDLTQWLNG